MRTTTVRAISTALLFFTFAGQVEADGFHLDGRTRRQIEAEAQRMIDEQLTPGLAIGIMSQGRIIYANGFGKSNLETCADASAHSVFGIGSVTKQFTAAAIVMLAEQGKLALEDPLSRFFPTFPRANEVTIRHLLTHTSGIHSLPNTPERNATLQTTAQVVAAIQNQAKVYDFDPGTKSQYSNAGYNLLAAIIEQVSGSGYGNFLRESLLENTGTPVTAFDRPQDIVLNRVAGYNRERTTNELVNAPPTSTIPSIGAGGMRSTVVDLLNWQEALHGARVVSAAGVNTMTTPATLDNGQPLPGGLGGIVGADNGHKFFSADGGGPGVQASLKVYLNDDVAFALLANITEAGAQAPGQPDVPDTDAVTTMKNFLSALITNNQRHGPHANPVATPARTETQRSGTRPGTSCKRSPFDVPALSSSP